MLDEAKKSKKVLARAYRPETLSQVVGQKSICEVLKNSVRLKRVSNAYLFSGTRGVGKTSLARIFAKLLNCKNLDENLDPCLKCENCVSIKAGTNSDVIEIDGASNNGVDDIRRLQDSVGFLPVSARYKVVIIDEVHMLSKGAFNALLKTLEEAPDHLVFIFATTEVYKVPETVLSRCLDLKFQPIESSELENRIAEVLKSESIKADKASVSLLAKEARGSLRDALSLLDYAILYCGEKLDSAALESSLGIVSESRFELLTKELLNLSFKNLAPIQQLADDLASDLAQVDRFVENYASYISGLLFSESSPTRADKYLLWFELLKNELMKGRFDVFDSALYLRMLFARMVRLNNWFALTEESPSAASSEASSPKLRAQAVSLKAEKPKSAVSYEEKSARNQAKPVVLEPAVKLDASSLLSILSSWECLFEKGLEQMFDGQDFRLENESLLNLFLDDSDSLHEVRLMKIDRMNRMLKKKGLSIKVSIKKKLIKPLEVKENVKSPSQDEQTDDRLEIMNEVFPDSKLQVLID